MDFIFKLLWRTLKHLFKFVHQFKKIILNTNNYLNSEVVNPKFPRMYVLIIIELRNTNHVITIYFSPFRFEIIFSNFSCRFLNPNIFSNLNYNCSNLLDLRNLQVNPVKKHSVTRNFTV